MNGLRRSAVGAVVAPVVLRTENKKLHTENKALKFENANLKEELRSLEGNISKEHGQRLEEIRERLLQFLAAQEGLVKASDVASALKIGEQLATFHLTDMEKQRLISASYAIGAPVEWRIDQDGRGYLVRHGLLI